MGSNPTASATYHGFLVLDITRERPLGVVCIAFQALGAVLAFLRFYLFWCIERYGLALSRKLTKKPVANLGPGRDGDEGGLCLVLDPSGAWRWIVRVTVKGQ